MRCSDGVPSIHRVGGSDLGRGARGRIANVDVTGAHAFSLAVIFFR